MLIQPAVLGLVYFWEATLVGLIYALLSHNYEPTEGFNMRQEATTDVRAVVLSEEVRDHSLHDSAGIFRFSMLTLG